MFTATDTEMMTRAIALAEQGRCLTTPNPFVGAVIVKNGRIIGEGFTQAGGRPHAEAIALGNCSESPKGATVYCTLEPCSLHAKSRGTACSDLLVNAKVARVVSAIQDPNPAINGAGHEVMRAAGIEVESGLMADVVKTQIKAFIARVTRGRPWVTLKLATSLDGKTALANGESKWITGVEARRDVHRMRAEACAVMTGIGTVETDDPQLTVRDVQCQRQPLRIVIDNRLDILDDAKILQGGNTLIVTSTGSVVRQAQLEALGLEVLRVDTAPDKGRVDLMKVMQVLATRGLNNIMVEAGSRLNAALIKAGVVDEVVVYLAPSLLGDPSRGAFALPEFTSLSERVNFKFTDSRQVGDDIRITAEVI